MSDASFSFSEFQALEQKVLRAVEIVKQEREARATAEAEVVTLKAEVESLKTQVAAHASATESEVATLNKERDAIRQRVESMLAQMDELI